MRVRVPMCVRDKKGVQEFSVEELNAYILTSAKEFYLLLVVNGN